MHAHAQQNKRHAFVNHDDGDDEGNVSTLHSCCKQQLTHLDAHENPHGVAAKLKQMFVNKIGF